MDFGLTLQGINLAVDTTKKLLALSKDIENVEFRALLVELQENILDVKEQNLVLREQVTELEAKIKQKDEYQYDGKFYWLNIDTDQKDGPFCPTCLDKDGKAIRMGFSNKSTYSPPYFRCEVCKTHRVTE